METAIRERRIAERKYEKLLERSGIPPRACKEADTPGWQPLPDLFHTSDSGSGSEDEKEAGKHGQKYKGRNMEANLSGISKETRRPPQYRPKKMKNQGLKETMILRNLTETLEWTNPTTHMRWPDTTTPDLQRIIHNQNLTPPPSQGA